MYGNIYLHENHQNPLNVGTVNTPYMDPMGRDRFLHVLQPASFSPSVMGISCVHQAKERPMGFSGTINNGTRHPCYFHTTPIRMPKDVEIVWEAYHKDVP